MKFSIITPTHKITPYLLELFESLEAQTHEDWEWELFLNGSAKVDDLPDAIKSCVQVNITESDIKDSNIGLIKNEAFSKGTGDILVEVDHDDLLMPECLEKLAEAFSDDSVGFAYSNDLLYDTRGGEKIRWNPAYGWTESFKEFRGDTYYAPESFPPSSRSLSFIWYAPDHVRAWRKTTYEELGGHDKTLEVCDDHDLLLRTYLHTTMKHIPEVLYVYRLLDNDDNTFLKRNEEIQIKTRELFNKYARTLAEHDADKAGLLKIDIGGGLYPYPGYTTIDQAGADIIYDLNNGIPLPDNSVGVINASHVIEHLRDPVKTMSEIHRVLCDGGWAFIDVPSTDGRGAFQDPTHVSFWNENSFWYYTRRQQAQYIRNNTIRFQAFKLETAFDSEWDRQNNIPVVKAVLCAVKSNERRPHLLEI